MCNKQRPSGLDRFLHQGQLSKEPTSELEHSWTRFVFATSDDRVALHQFQGKHQDEGCNVGLLCERARCGCRTIDALCATSSVFTNNWRVHEALDARCALDVERRSGAFVERILPTWFHLEACLWPSGTRKSSRWRPEHQEDANVKENHKRCNLSQQQQHCSAEKK